jgi:hypothetical protein
MEKKQTERLLGNESPGSFADQWKSSPAICFRLRPEDGTNAGDTYFVEHFFATGDLNWPVNNFFPYRLQPDLKPLADLEWEALGRRADRDHEQFMGHTVIVDPESGVPGLVVEPTVDETEPAGPTEAVDPVVSASLSID